VAIGKEKEKKKEASRPLRDNDRREGEEVRSERGGKGEGKVGLEATFNLSNFLTEGKGKNQYYSGGKKDNTVLKRPPA